MKTINVSEVTGPVLNWLVAKCEGLRVEFNHQYTEDTKFDGWWQCGPFHWQPLMQYSTDWAQGGPLIERDRISVISDYHEIEEGWLAEGYDNGIQAFGATPLIAAMRVYVIGKLGDVVDVPDELV